MSTRGRPRQFSLEDVVDAGLALIEESGTEALSMSALAARLGTGSATLYNYVGSRDELIDLMIGRILTEQPPVAETIDADNWDEGLVAYMVAVFRASMVRPALLQLALQSPRLHLGALARGQEELQALEAIGFSPTRAAEVYRILGSQLLGHVGAAVALHHRPDDAVMPPGTSLGDAQRHLDALGEERLYESAVRTVVVGLRAELTATTPTR